jgi:RTX calcium-binding nonapeptide repeat (4 copies)
MSPRRPLPHLLAAALALLLAAAPAAAGGMAEIDGVVLRYTADEIEPVNVTIDRVDGVLRLDENASRPRAGAGCAVSADDPYRVECPETGIERIEVRLGALGSDVRIRADLPAKVDGGPGDDLIVGGPAEDAIDGGAGQDILGGGAGADLLHGGPGLDLVTYADRIGRDGALLGRRGGVTLAVARANASGARDERDTIPRDVEQLAGGAGGDRFSLRDGLATGIACGAGRDSVTADARDSVEIDCESTRVASQPGGARLTTPTLPFPFAGVNDRGRSTIAVEPLLPLQGGAVVVRVSCPAGLGLLELVRALPCTGHVRFTRAGSEMGVRRVSVPRGGAITVRLPLSESRGLARRAQGLTITATALPDRGSVQRALTFRVKG